MLTRHLVRIGITALVVGSPVGSSSIHGNAQCRKALMAACLRIRRGSRDRSVTGANFRKSDLTGWQTSYELRKHSPRKEKLDRLRHRQPAEGAQCAQHGTMEELRAAFTDIKAIPQSGCDPDWLGGKIVHRRSDIGELAKHDVVNAEGVHAPGAVGAGPDREPGQACDCLHPRICARRRVRDAMACTMRLASRMRSWNNRRCSWASFPSTATQRLPRLVGQRDRDATGAARAR